MRVGTIDVVTTPKWFKSVKRILATLAIIYIVILLFLGLFQRNLIYFPTHRLNTGPLTNWVVDGNYQGCSREVASPKNIWLVLHGQRGQAASHNYIVQCLPKEDSVYIVEYPGFGLREGSHSQAAFNAAAYEALLLLRKQFPKHRICVVGESLGSGPASYLGSVENAPDKIVLIVPFDSLPSLAQDRFPFVPAGWALYDRWDNIASLANYKGKVDIYAGSGDMQIPAWHARNLAKNVKGAVYHEFEGGHNDWRGTTGVISAE